MSDGLLHVIRTTHHDTGELVMYCGQTRQHPPTVTPSNPACLNCVLGVIKALESGMLDYVTKQGERNDWLGHYDSATLRISILEEQVEKAGKRIKTLTKRRAKVGKKSKGKG